MEKLKENAIESQNKFKEPKSQIIAMKNLLLKKTRHMPILQQKLFYLVLSQLDYTKENGNIVLLYKQDVFDILHFNSESKYTRVKQGLEELQLKTQIRFQRGEAFETGFLFKAVGYDGTDYYKIKLNEDYMPLIQNLDNNYTRLLLEDLVNFKSSFSIIYYQMFMMHNNVTEWKPTTKELKETLGLKKSDYSKKDGKFDRTNFEKRCIQKPIDEINKVSKALYITWKKAKRGGKVLGYNFTYNIKDINKIVAERTTHNKYKNTKNYNYDDIEIIDYKWWLEEDNQE